MAAAMCSPFFLICYMELTTKTPRDCDVLRHSEGILTHSPYSPYNSSPISVPTVVDLHSAQIQGLEYVSVKIR